MPEKVNTHTEREAWLNAAARLYSPWFSEQGYPLPAFRVACGFTSYGARGKAIGQCWSPVASADGTSELMVSPKLDAPMKILGVLFHELVHAAVGTEHGHKGPFKRLAKAGGLEGKMTATTEGPAFILRATPILEALGPYPHASLDAMLAGRKKQSTRLLKAHCPVCGYTVRIAKKWLDLGAPICPIEDEDTGDSHGQMVADGADESEGEDA